MTGAGRRRNTPDSEISIHQPEGWSLGLFGCIANTKIGNFTLENAQVEGTVMVSCVVGYAYNSEVKDVQLASGKVDVNYTEMSSEGMYGGIVGAGLIALSYHSLLQLVNSL